MLFSDAAYSLYNGSPCSHLSLFPGNHEQRLLPRHRVAVVPRSLVRPVQRLFDQPRRAATCSAAPCEAVRRCVRPSVRSGQYSNQWLRPLPAPDEPNCRARSLARSRTRSWRRWKISPAVSLASIFARRRCHCSADAGATARYRCNAPKRDVLVNGYIFRGGGEQRNRGWIVGAWANFGFRSKSAV